jgi:hypothetical protein
MPANLIVCSTKFREYLALSLSCQPSWLYWEDDSLCNQLYALKRALIVITTLPSL